MSNGEDPGHWIGRRQPALAGRDGCCKTGQWFCHCCSPKMKRMETDFGEETKRQSGVRYGEKRIKKRVGRGEDYVRR